MSKKLCLHSLLAPKRVNDFLSQYWEQQPLLISRKSQHCYAGLLTTSDLDSLISQIRSPHTASLLRVVKRDGDQLISKTVPYTQRGNPDIHFCYAALDEGYTIILNGLDQRWRSISMLCRRLEAQLNNRIGANAYFTPSGSQGFLPHADDHDVFILQLEGSKDWTIYKPIVHLPLEEQRVKIRIDALGKPLKHARLNAGDLLYIPRGFIHEGLAGGFASLHLTIGIHAYRWLDLVKEIATVAAEQTLALRKAVPPLTMGSPSGINTVQTQCQSLMDRLTREVPVEDALARLRARLLESANPVLDGYFSTIGRTNRITLDSRVYKRLGPNCIVSHDNGRATIHFAGNSVTGPASIEPALRFLTKTREFRVRDLPGGLSDRSKLVLVRRLVKEGLLSSRLQRSC